MASAEFSSDDDDEPIPAGIEIGRLVQERRFCEAARLYAEWSGCDYIESKLAIDRLARKHGLAPHRGCASYFMVLLVGVGVGFWWGLG